MSVVFTRMTTINPRDRVYEEEREAVERFEFDENVAAVFDDMIRRSAPGYEMTLSFMPLIAARYGRGGSSVYDLGCSLGAGMLALLRGAPKSMRWIGVDQSEAMLERCRENLVKPFETESLELRREDILETPIEDASLVCLNFTLQFIPQDQRESLLRRIHAGLRPGGVLLLSEKTRWDDTSFQDAMTALHHDFKRAQGYSALEISQKRAALENVLVPETIETHKRRLSTAGFSTSETWLQFFNFMSILAIK